MHLRFLSGESIIIYKLVLSSVWLPSHSVRVICFVVSTFLSTLLRVLNCYSLILTAE